MTEMPALRQVVDAMTPWQRSAFAAAFTQRMLPNFTLFSRLLRFGDVERICRIMDGVWEHLRGGASMNFEVQLEAVEANIPSLEEFDNYGVMPAHDAVVALYTTLLCILEEDPADAVSVANLSREAVATFIEVNEADAQMSDERLLRFIATHELMQDEDAFCEEVIERLQSVHQPDRSFIDQLRALATNEGFSNLGICDDV